MLDRLKRRALRLAYLALDRLFKPLDDRLERACRNLDLIPPAAYRYGGQASLAEYAHTAGVISGIIAAHVPRPTTQGLQVIDFGCGTGKLIPAALSHVDLEAGGRIVGLDLDRKALDFCRAHYPAGACSFEQLEAQNKFYNPHGVDPGSESWDLADGSFDLALALSVFTHLREPDARHYMKILSRKLRPHGTAIFTFFILDESYDPARLTGTRWDFDLELSGEDWRTSSQFDVPEAQIGVTTRGLNALAEAAEMSIERVYPGFWKGGAGAFLQDIVVLRRSAREAIDR